ncbi:hypothetical protein PGT21_013953 [Puccinia graminis f. sp. tritici]|uniref:Uncharacterized protein n=1 Tax=Puccinia graminis f. sp. tritici TaxID=56615 RepID=A0A5B0MEN6_PUCGR|nr:hypothetical protein PGT21_013953 [Puccinia graminis f. sp. tritici]
MCIPRVASVNQQGPSRRFLPGLYWIWKLLQAAYQSTARPVGHDRAGELDGVKQATNSNAISASTQTVSSSPVWPPPAGSNTLHQHSKREVSDDPIFTVRGKALTAYLFLLHS